MMFYNDLIIPQSEYTYSANIQFDIVDDKKLYRFVPNETAIELLKSYFIDMISNNPNHHSRILYGSYGTGKSHFLTVLSLLLSKQHTDGVAFDTFLTKITKLDSELSNDIEQFVKTETKAPFLIVPIVFDFEDFDRCIYFSLQKALEQIGVNLTFKNFYSQALELVNNWCNNVESEAHLEQLCEHENLSIDALKQYLKQYNPVITDTFKRIFSGMTYGVPFVHEVANLTDSINQAYESISDNYSGIVFIFDEFGRYIEDNIRKIKVKQIQDLAEFCDHSKANHHLILVSHKEISLYTNEFSEEIANEWKKVEGRFNATLINDKQDQCLTLIPSVLNKNAELWKGFQKKFNKELNRLYSSAIGFKGFLVDSNTSNPFEDAFPLHPITLFALDKLSKKVAQNERTIFTYLSSSEENSLMQFLSSHELDTFSFIGIDEIFDYFEPSIKAVQSSSAYSIYKEYTNAISKGSFDTKSKSIELRILKCIAIINIIDDTNSLNADIYGSIR